MKCCCKLPQRRGNEYDSDSEVGPSTYQPYEKSERSCACKILIWTVSIIFALLVLTFLVIWVVLPLVFMNTVSIQRKLMFLNYDQPDNPEYTNYALYGAKGVRNMYITVDDEDEGSVSLGVWQVVPESRINVTSDFAAELRNSMQPICIYFHGQSGTRIFPLPTYEKLRQNFHVLAMDYRSYGDSTEAELTEEDVVNDLVQFYYKVLSMTNQPDVYFWSHSLGTALATYTLRKITEQHGSAVHKRLPRGLILEAPFTTMREEIAVHPIGKFFAWMPWFDATIRDPLEDNGFRFLTAKNILSVNCPIMIIHAKDDSVIPFTLGEELADIGNRQRNMTTQGDVTLHLVPASARCDHMGINTYIEFPEFIKQFLIHVDDWYERHSGMRSVIR